MSGPPRHCPPGRHDTADRLGAWAGGGLSARHRAEVSAHLARCSDCRALASELTGVNGGLVRAAT